MPIRAPIGRDAGLSEIREASDALLLHTVDGVITADHEDISTTANKGVLGELLESYYGIDNNNDSGPDFTAEEIELKGKPLTFSYDEYVYPAEPLSLGMLDYGEVAETQDWQDVEKLQQKLLRLLIVWHHSDPDDKRDFRYLWWQFIEFPDEYVARVQSEYETIRQQILDGEHLSQSAADNDYLQACPKHNDESFQNLEDGSFVVDSGHPHIDKPERQSWRLPCRFLVRLLADSLDTRLVSHGTTQYVRKGVVLQQARERATAIDSTGVTGTVSYEYQSDLDRYL